LPFGGKSQEWLRFMANDTSSTDPRIVEGFDPELIWAQHGQKITVVLAVLAVLGTGFFWWQIATARKAEAAAVKLAAARDATALAQVVADYPRQEVAAQALLRLGDLHFRDGKYAEAAADYQRLLEQFPAHPLLPSALLGLAAVQETEGRFDVARTHYERILSAYPQGYATLPAGLGVARCLEGLGLIKESRQKYEEMMALAQGSPAQVAAYLRWTMLGRELPPESPVAVGGGAVKAE